jgi:hypothetical protein
MSKGTARTRLRDLVVMIVALVASVGLGSGVAEAACPAGLEERTIDQVLTDLYAARAAADWKAVGCNYGKNAFLIDDQGVLVGRAEIVASLMSWDDLFGGVQPVVHEANYFNDVARVTFTVDGGWVVVEDGVSTYLIRNGKIRRQTFHGVITFTGPPPEFN